MDKTRALGRWPNAPLAYLVAEIKFQRAQDFDSALPLLVELLANDFPLEEASQTFEATLEPGQQQPTLERVRDFKNFAATMGVRTTKGSFALHCTNYAGWTGAFEDVWTELIKKVATTLRPRVLLRSSLRYIDLLVPDDGESPDNMLAEGLRPWHVNGEGLGEFEQGNKAHRFKNGPYATTVVVLSRVKGQIVLPPNISAMPLALSPPQQRALKFHSRTSLPFAILDSDVAHEAATPFDVDQIKVQFSELHRLTSTAFLAATSPEAQKRWQQA
jgi:uncharacterized protein (TIGR04255 family)